MDSNHTEPSHKIPRTIKLSECHHDKKANQLQQVGVNINEGGSSLLDSHHHPIGWLKQPHDDHELNLIDKLGSSFSSCSSSSSPLSDQQTSRKEIRFKYSCNYCNRKFANAQALGGHQNAHKHERKTLAKRRVRQHNFLPEASAASPPPSAFAYSNVLNRGHYHDNHNYHYPSSVVMEGTLANRSLGIQTHSMIHKPSSLLSPSYAVTSNSEYLYGGGNQGWLRPLVVPMDHHHQLPISRLVNPGESVAPDDKVHICGGGARSFEINTNQDELDEKLDLSLKLP